MQKTVYVCDVCRDQSKDVGADARVWLHLDRQMDPSGNGYENVGEEVHVCHACAVRVLRLLTSPRATCGFGAIDNAAFLEFVRAGARKETP